jgi:hypothetical protein
MNFSKTIKLGNITFTSAPITLILLVLGIAFLVKAPLLAVALFAVGALSSSDYRHRIPAIIAVGVVSALLLGAWPLVAAAAISAVIVHKQVRNATAISLFVLGFALLLMGSVVLGVLVALAGIVISKFGAK